MARYIFGSLTICTALLAAGCARATETPHVCNDADIQHWVARGKLPAKDYTFRVSLDGAGVKFSGAEYPLEIKATYFDSKGSCTIASDKLVVTWSQWQAGGEMPMTLNGAKAVFRPTHPGAYAFNATVKYAPMQPWSGMLSPLPVITHEQNAVLYLNQSLDVASGFDPNTMHEIPASLHQLGVHLRDAYRSLDDGNSADAIQQLESFRANMASAHPNDPAWADVISKADDLIAGVRLGDHRFDTLPLHMGPAYW